MIRLRSSRQAGQRWRRSQGGRAGRKSLGKIAKNGRPRRNGHGRLRVSSLEWSGPTAPGRIGGRVGKKHRKPSGRGRNVDVAHHRRNEGGATSGGNDGGSCAVVGSRLYAGVALAEDRSNLVRNFFLFNLIFFLPLFFVCIFNNDSSLETLNPEPCDRFHITTVISK